MYVRMYVHTVCRNQDFEELKHFTAFKQGSEIRQTRQSKNILTAILINFGQVILVILVNCYLSHLDDFEHFTIATLTTLDKRFSMYVRMYVHTVCQLFQGCSQVFFAQTVKLPSKEQIAVI